MIDQPVINCVGNVLKILKNVDKSYKVMVEISGMDVAIGIESISIQYTVDDQPVVVFQVDKEEIIQMLQLD